MLRSQKISWNLDSLLLQQVWRSKRNVRIIARPFKLTGLYHHSGVIAGGSFSIARLRMNQNARQTAGAVLLFAGICQFEPRPLPYGGPATAEFYFVIAMKTKRPITKTAICSLLAIAISVSFVWAQNRGVAIQIASATSEAEARSIVAD